MRALQVEYHAPARFDDLIECFVRVSRIGRTSVTYGSSRPYRLPDDELHGDRDADVGADRPRHAPARADPGERASHACARSRAASSRELQRSPPRCPPRGRPVDRTAAAA